MTYTPAFISSTLKGEMLQQEAGDLIVEHISIDSRKISFPAHTIFFALTTKQRNGHAFIQQAYEKGVRCFVVSEKTEQLAGATIILVPDTLSALQSLAAYHRHQFKYPVIGITGSNGKTIVKEWLFHLLETEMKIVRSPKSYNSQVGVPVSVWEMNGDAELAIFEAGISTVNEMDKLQTIIDPTIGVITHIGDAHDEGFGSTAEKVKEKLKLFAASEVVIFNADDPLVTEQLKSFTCKKISWGYTRSADFIITKTVIERSSARIFLQAPGHNYEFVIPFTTNAAIENAVICFVVCYYLQADLSKVCESMASLQQMDMRLQLQKAINNCIIINDAYSFDLDSLQIALDFLHQQQKTYHSTVILSDLPEQNKNGYDKVVEMLKHQQIQRSIFIGNEWMQRKSSIEDQLTNTAIFETVEKFSAQFSNNQFQHEIILIKGARQFRFDELQQLFQQQVHQTVMEINLTAIVNNLNIFRSKLKPGVKLMAMVKAFGYGSGGAEIAKLLAFHHADYLAVAYADEGIALRKEGITLPILVLNVDETAFHSIVEYDLEPEIFSFNILHAFLQFIKQQGVSQYPVHLKIDTGMHRLGFEENDIDELLKNITSNNSVIIRSVFSHLVASEDEGMDEFTLQQFNLFQQISDKIRSALRYEFISHISNSAAIFRLPQLQQDMVRLGIGLYGVEPGGEALQLQTVARVKTTIAQIRKVKAGDSVGYNRKGIVTKDSIIATLRIGYADGYRRALGNKKGQVFINGKFAPVIGNVCMDMLMVDITDIEGVEENDEVEVLGENINVKQMAEWCETIPYEILTGIGQRVKRVYLIE
jgi:alanine racemase